jgi:hypothetical protein
MGASWDVAIKETGVDNAAHLDFYETYFRFPIYKDPKWDIYHAMGGRKISTWNALTNTAKLLKRFNKKNITCSIWRWHMD